MVSFLYLTILLVLNLKECTGYSVSGNQILDVSGNEILIRGVDRPSLEWDSQGQYMQFSDYQLMQEWGANVIRLSLSQCFYLPSLPQYDSSYSATIDQQVTLIKSLGMGVILDLHWSNQGSVSTECGQQAMADSFSISFWQQLAAKYANDPSIMFELYNEPFVTDWPTWLNGGTSAGYITVGMQQLYDAVRGTGANNIVIIGGINYGYDLSKVISYLVNGTNIVYNTHPYNFPGKQPSNWNEDFGYLLSSYPVIATEFGDTTSCDTTYYLEFLQYAEVNNIHWTAWGWWAGNCSFPSLIEDWQGTPSGSGALIKSYLPEYSLNIRQAICDIGSENCSCTQGGACNQGLTCVKNVAGSICLANIKTPPPKNTNPTGTKIAIAVMVIVLVVSIIVIALAIKFALAIRPYDTSTDSFSRWARRTYDNMR